MATIVITELLNAVAPLFVFALGLSLAGMLVSQIGRIGNSMLDGGHTQPPPAAPRPAPEPIPTPAPAEPTPAPNKGSWLDVAVVLLFEFVIKRACPYCGAPNAPYRSNCAACGAPMKR